MGIVALEGMRFFAFHGYYEEEQQLGNEFILDILVNTDFSVAAATDELYTAEAEAEEEQTPTTVNYETIFLLCKAEMNQNTKLLEALIDRIADRIIKHFEDTDLIDGLLVRLRKMHPPLGGRVHSSWLVTTRGEMDLSYMQLIKKLGQ